MSNPTCILIGGSNIQSRILPGILEYSKYEEFICIEAKEPAELYYLGHAWQDELVSTDYYVLFLNNGNAEIYLKVEHAHYGDLLYIEFESVLPAKIRNIRNRLFLCNNRKGV